VNIRHPNTLSLYHICNRNVRHALVCLMNLRNQQTSRCEYTCSNTIYGSTKLLSSSTRHISRCEIRPIAIKLPAQCRIQVPEALRRNSFPTPRLAALPARKTTLSLNRLSSHPVRRCEVTNLHHTGRHPVLRKTSTMSPRRARIRSGIRSG
jgi:hypothetical protein